MHSRHVAVAVATVAVAALAIAAGCSKNKSTNPVVGGGGNTPFNSGVHNSPFSFDRTFPDAGDVPYFCSVHLSAMTGMVHVSATATSIDTTVSVVNNAYNPSSVTIRPGGKVTWNWAGSNHSVTSGTP
jgi:plastocyanin